MAQNKKPKQGKRAPAYSADGMVVSLIVGLILIALGVLIFLAAALKLDADIFNLLRTFSSGLAGSLAIALPIIPIWGGVLVIMSTQRKAPKREFILGCVLMLLILTTVTLCTFMSGSVSLMDAILSDVRRDNVGEGMSSFLSDAFEYGSGSKRNDGLSIGGGFLGMLLAWPLWKGFGVPFAIVITVLLSLVVFCFLIRLDVKGIGAALRQKSADHRIRREQQQLQQREQELIWQQEQAARQEQLRLQQEQFRQQQMQQMQQMQQQRVQYAPQPQQPEPLDPWSSMMPAGTANWNQTQGRMQPAQGPQGSQPPLGAHGS